MRKPAAIILYLFVGLPLLLSAFLAVSTRAWILDRGTYTRALTNDRLYEILRSPAMAAEVDETLVIDGASLNGPALVAALQKDPPVAELKALAAQAVNDGFDFIEGRSRGERLDLDLAPLKSALEARAPALARDYVAALPVQPGKPADGDYSFRPQGLSSALIASRAGTLLRDGISENLPDRLPWPPAAMPVLTVSENGEVLTLARIDTGITGLAIISLLVTGGLALLGSPNLRQRLRMAGGFILAPALLVLVVAATFAITGISVEKGLMPDALRQAAGSDGRAALAGYFLGSFLGSQGGVAGPYFIVGLVASCAGGLLISLRRWIGQDIDE